MSEIEIDFFDIGEKKTSTTKTENQIKNELIKKQLSKEDITLSNDVKSRMNIVKIPLTQVKDNPYQPRRSYDKESIIELSLSIKKEGLLQPIGVVRSNGDFILKYGHRRLRAFQLLKKNSIDAIVYDEDSPQSLLSSSLIENIQRNKMNNIDTALSFKKALDENVFKNQAKLAEAIGKDASYVGKLLKILTLPDDIISDLMKNNSITDKVVLDLIRRIKNSDDCRYIYQWTVKNKPSRTELKQKIAELSSSDVNPDFPRVKSTKTGHSIEIPKLSEDKMARITDFIQKICEE